MKRLIGFIFTFMFVVAMNAQSYATVKREGGYTNIRKGPGTGYGIVKKVKDGSGIYVGSSSGGWRPVYSGPNGYFIGYISSSKVVFGNSNSSYRSSRNLARVMVRPEGGYTNLRSGPGTKYRIIGKVKDGTYVYADPTINGRVWSKVYYANGSFRGWIADSKLMWGYY